MALTRSEQNRRWKSTVDKGLQVFLEEHQIELVDDRIWEQYQRFEPKDCPTGDIGGTELSVTGGRTAILSKGEYQPDEYACTVITPHCVAESENPTGSGTRYDPHVTVAARAYSPSMPESRHTTRLMPTRIAPRGIGVP